MLTIISPAESHRLTTLATIKSELRLTSGADDDFLSSLIDQASGAIRTWCGRSFALETVRETIHLKTASESVMLSRWPVVSIVAVTASDQALGPVTFEAEDESGFIYRTDSSGDRVGWPSGKVVLEYSAGYVLPGKPGRTLPDDIERAVLTMIKGEWFARNRDPLIRSEDVNGVANTTYWVGGFGGDVLLPPDVQGLLTKHRQVLIG